MALVCIRFIDVDGADGSLVELSEGLTDFQSVIKFAKAHFRNNHYIVRNVIFFTPRQFMLLFRFGSCNIWTNNVRQIVVESYNGKSDAMSNSKSCLYMCECSSQQMFQFVFGYLFGCKVSKAHTLYRFFLCASHDNFLLFFMFLLIYFFLRPQISIEAISPPANDKTMQF